jgi:hypothetical protein
MIDKTELKKIELKDIKTTFIECNRADKCLLCNWYVGITGEPPKPHVGCVILLGSLHQKYPCMANSATKQKSGYYRRDE